MRIEKGYRPRRGGDMIDSPDRAKDFFDHFLKILERNGINLPSPCNTLDLGAGRGEMARFLGELGHEVKALERDPDPDQVFGVDEGRAEAMPYGDGSFNLIVSYRMLTPTLYSDQNSRQIFSEVNRVLTVQGIFYSTADEVDPADLEKILPSGLRIIETEPDPPLNHVLLQKA